jgi:hypothetical protein
VPAAAVDRPIDAVRLVLKRTANGATLEFVTRDPDFLFPPIGSADDPGTGTPGGMLIELFSANEGLASLAIPPGAGNPGWTASAARSPARHRFRNRLAPGGASVVRSVDMREGRVLEIDAKSAGLPLLGPQGSVAIRLTIGTRRSCALFDAPTIRKDEAGRFSARDAVATSLSDCSDLTLGGRPCQIVFDPFEPMCGGTCPAGQRCVVEVNGGIAPSCICLPRTETPCFDSGYPSCGGSCGGAEQCQATHIRSTEGPVDLTLCACVDPQNICDDPAGTCFEVGVCPPAQVCNAFGPPQSMCGCGAP